MTDVTRGGGGGGRKALEANMLSSLLEGDGQSGRTDGTRVSLALF